jgi:sporulation protein YlmC with PRC-barrel domain
MAEAVPFTIGAAVSCSDGPCGNLTKVVVDPVARAVTHVVVEPEHRSGLARLVALGVIEPGTDAKAIRLGIALDEFEALPHAEETEFLPGGSGESAYEAHELYYWPYFGLEGGVAPSVAPYASGLVTRDTIPAGEVEVRRGDRVHASDGEIGKVEGLVVEPASGRVTHVLLQEGHLWGRKQVAIPMTAVVKMDDGVSVSLSRREIEALPAVDLSHPGR